MPTQNPPRPLEAALKGPAGEFSFYCQEEFQRRSNSGEDFDAELYEEAVQFVLSKLQKRQGSRAE
jgi:hypothetical protein